MATKIIFHGVLLIFFLQCYAIAQILEAEQKQDKAYELHVPFPLVNDVELDSCWKLYYPHEPERGYFNPDSVMVDTCLSDSDYTMPWAYKVLYAKKWFRVILPLHSLHIPAASSDTIIIRTWQDIDTSFANVRNGFSAIDSIFGGFILMKEFPDVADSSWHTTYTFLMEFENYVNIDTLQMVLYNIYELEDAYYQVRYVRYPSNHVLNSEKNSFQIYPNPVSTLADIRFTSAQLGAYYLRVVSISGEVLQTVQGVFNSAGEQSVTLKTEQYLPGIYFIQIRHGRQTLTHKLIIVK